jgi:plastocyanin
VRFVPVALLTALLLLAAGCGSSGLNRPVSSVTAAPDAKGVQVVEVKMHSYYFEPNRIVVKAGQPVDLVLKNKTKFYPHNFTIADSALSMSESAWLGTDHLRFTPTVPGEYEFFCHVDHHSKKGMTGTLVVTP